MMPSYLLFARSLKIRQRWTEWPPDRGLHRVRAPARGSWRTTVVNAQGRAIEARSVAHLDQGRGYMGYLTPLSGPACGTRWWRVPRRTWINRWPAGECR